MRADWSLGSTPVLGERPTFAAHPPGPMHSLLTLSAALAVSAAASAQITVPRIPGTPLDSSLVGLFDPVSQLSAGLGLTSIDGGDDDGEFFLLDLSPEFNLAPLGLRQVGLGLDAPLRFQVGGGEDGSGFQFRSEDYDEQNEVLSIIRYVRYGRKQGNEALYARFGAIDFGRIGYGSLVEGYRNEVGEDGRTRGGAFDLDLAGIGVETLYGSFTEAGVYAGRGFIRPFRVLGGSEGGLNNLEIGVTVAGDLNSEGGFVNADAPGEPFALGAGPDGGPTADGVAGVGDEGALRAYGLDVGLRLTGSDAYQLGLYADVTHLDGYGTGGGGLLLTVNPPGTATFLSFRLGAIYEGEQFTPTLFNAFYEVDRLVRVDSVMNAETGRREARFQSRRNLLLAADEASGGVVAQMSGILAGLVRVEGRFQQDFATAEGGWLHLGADLRLPGGFATARAGLDAWNIGGDDDEPALSGMGAGDYRLSAEATLQPHPNLAIGLTAASEFAPVYEGGEVIDQVRQDRFEPVVRLVLPIGQGLGGL